MHGVLRLEKILLGTPNISHSQQIFQEGGIKSGVSKISGAG
jgi:hypothetical protein